MSITNKHNPLVKAIRTALFAGVAASIAVAPTAFAADEEEDEDENTVTVTGSRIKRSDFEGALPVTVIDREMIELSGESNASDFLRNLTFNSAGSFRPKSGSSAQGTASINLRGIGSSRTLVLVDGRRLPKSPSTGSNQDLNTVPMGAIERIEILSDGASAVYGSDAMGGVVNIITRQDFEGVEIMLGGSQVSLPYNGGDREQGSIVFGSSSDTSSLIGGVSWNKRDIIFARDFWFNQGGGSYFGNSYSGYDSGFWDVRNFPEGDLGETCDWPGTAFFSTYSYTDDDGNDVNRCAYDYTQVSADEASTGNKSLWLKATHDINDNWQIWMNSSVNKSHSFGRYAPVPDGTYFTDVPIAADSPNNPTNPDSPMWDGVSTVGIPMSWWHRFDALGNRDTFVDNELVDLQTGVTGSVNDIELDFGLRITKNRTAEVGYNYLLRSAAQAAIDDGSYNLNNPYSATEATLNGMSVTTTRMGKYDQNEMWASAAFDLFEMDAGSVQTFIGVEYREEFFEDRYDSLSEAGQVGGSSGNSSGGSRDVTAIYFETLIPVTETLEVSIAGRQDDYSDYGSDFSPKVSMRWQAMDNLTVRASYGEGFRAPSLDILTQKDSFSADTVRGDPQTCANQSLPDNCEVQINGLRTANPDLGSEQSTQMAMGLAYEATEWFNFTADWYSIEINDRINFFSAQELVNKELAGDPIPTGLGVERAANGSINRVVQGYGNEGSVETEGLDFNFVFSYELFDGRMNNNIQIGHLLSQTVDGGRELVGDPGAPASRMTIANSYEMGDFSVGYNLNLIADQCDDIIDGECIGHVPTYVTHDIQFNYFVPWDGKITVGVRNAGEKKPPIGVGYLNQRDYDFNLYDAYGRVTYVQYTQTF